jgi:hypothetical protein
VVLLRELGSKFKEASLSVLPISAVALVLYLIVGPADGFFIAHFIVGALILILGMALFTYGADIATMPMGNEIGSYLSSSKKIWLLLSSGLVIGIFITIAEPDLAVLAELVPGIPNTVLILTVAIGVGVFLLAALMKTIFSFSLSKILVFLYVIVFVLAAFISPDYLPLAFDSGGVTTGPITVPFILALGVGVTSVRASKSSEQDSFGLVALCSVGPILSVMILSLIYRGGNIGASTASAETAVNAGVFGAYLDAIPEFASEVALALAPILVAFLLFQFFALKLPKKRVVSILIGFVITYIGLVLFLVAANIGYIPIGSMLGASIAGSDLGWVIIPLGCLMGMVVILAEPAVHVLNKEVEEVSSGAITKRGMLLSLSIGVGLSVGLAMLRVYTGVSIWWLILPGYAIALALSFVVPPVYTAIAFDSGGVASGPMTATFLLAFSMGATEAVGGSVTRDAFGTVAMVAMTPLLTIQIMGLAGTVGRKRAYVPSFEDELEIIDLDWEAAV